MTAESAPVWGCLIDRWHNEKRGFHLLRADGSPSCGVRYHASAGEHPAARELRLSLRGAAMLSEALEREHFELCRRCLVSARRLEARWQPARGEAVRLRFTGSAEVFTAPVGLDVRASVGWLAEGYRPGTSRYVRQVGPRAWVCSNGRKGSQRSMCAIRVIA